MNIQCNNERVDVVSQNLAMALQELGFESPHFATAVNGEFVPKSMRATTVLKPGDKIDVVAPLQGG